MEKLVEAVDGEGLEALLGENVLLMCANYFYHGKLVGLNETCVLLDGTKIVYDTGSWSAKEWQFAEELPGAWYSGHEGYAVILEEVEELKDEVFWGPTKPSTFPSVTAKGQRVKLMRAEALQVAAMALRFIRDVCDREEPANA